MGEVIELDVYVDLGEFGGGGVCYGLCFLFCGGGLVWLMD